MLLTAIWPHDNGVADFHRSILCQA